MVFGFIGCESSNKSAPAAPFPKPGTTMDSASEPVTEDALNKFMFTVKVIADSSVSKGVYDVDVDFGPNFAEGQFTLPKGGEHFKPAIRKASERYTYIIGFHIPGDTTFYDYFEVTSNRGQTKMQYIKAYTF